MRILSLLLLLSSPFVCAAGPRFVPIPDSTIITSTGSYPTQFVRVGSSVYFRATVAPDTYQVWKTDGTESGTTRVVDFGNNWSIEGSLGNAVVIESRTRPAQPDSLWRSDGTPAGTYKLGDIPVPENAGAGYWTQVVTAGTRLFLLVQPNYSDPWELWTATDSAGSLQKVGSYPIDGAPLPFGIDGRLFFRAEDSAVGSLLWVSDGTARGTHVVQRDIECAAFGTNCGPAPKSFVRLDRGLFFFGENGLFDADARLVMPIERPFLVASSSTAAYFVVDEKYLWKTDGTAAGTHAISENIAYVPSLVTSDGRLVSALTRPNMFEIWITDGTAPVKIAEVPAGPSSEMPSMVGLIGARLVIIGYTPSVGWEPWVVDLDAHTAALLKDIDPRVIDGEPASSYPEPGMTIGNKLVFSAVTGVGREPWVTDGTAAGTKLLADIAPDSSSGIVSGTVRDQASNAPLANATVAICTATSCPDLAYTNPDGTYVFEGVVPGSYTLRAFTSRHLPAQVSVEVRAGFETAGVDFALVAGGSIAGTVRRVSDGLPVQSIEVRARDAAGNVVRTRTTDAGGHYTLGALVAGTYTVETHFNPHVDVLVVDQIYRDHDCPAAGCDWAAADRVTVTLGNELNGVDFALHSYGTISGTVLDASTQKPARFTAVSFIRTGRTSGEAIPSIAVDANGHYQSPLLKPGTYSVMVNSGAFGGMVYPNTPCEGQTCETTTGTALVVTPDAAITAIDFALVPVKGRMEGIVRDRTGAPFPGMTVRLLDQTGNYAYGWQATTSSDGVFVFSRIPPGTYYIRVGDLLYPNGNCASYPCDVSQATPFTVVEGQTTTADLQLATAPATVTGVVRDARTGELIDEDGAVTLIALDGAANETASTPLDHGHYTINTISRATSFYVVASADGWHDAAYPNIRTTCRPATIACIPAGAVAVPAGTATIDFALQPYGVISGTVLDAHAGEPIANMVVEFLSSSGESAGTITDENGHYRWPFAGGGYYVSVRPSDSRYTAQIYRGRNCIGVCDPRTGDLVTVADGGEASGIDFHLQSTIALGTISGRVVDDATGQPVADASVSAWGPGGFPRAEARTDADGRYTLYDNDAVRGLVTGDYRLAVEAGGPYFLALSGGVMCTDFYCDREAAIPVHLDAPNTTTVDFRLIRLRVTGISPAAGAPSGGTEVVIDGANFTADAEVRIGDNDARIVSVTPTRIVAVTPPGTPGPAHVTVQLAPNLAVTLAHGFEYKTPGRNRSARH